jgi:hypothetical protein
MTQLQKVLCHILTYVAWPHAQQYDDSENYRSARYLVNYRQPFVSVHELRVGKLEPVIHVPTIVIEFILLYLGQNALGVVLFGQECLCVRTVCVTS